MWDEKDWRGLARLDDGRIVLAHLVPEVEPVPVRGAGAARAGGLDAGSIGHLVHRGENATRGCRMIDENYYLEIDRTWANAARAAKPSGVSEAMLKSREFVDITRFILEDIGPNLGWILSLAYQMRQASTPPPRTFRLVRTADMTRVDLTGYSAEDIERILKQL